MKSAKGRRYALFCCGTELYSSTSESLCRCLSSSRRSSSLPMNSDARDPARSDPRLKRRLLLREALGCAFAKTRTNNKNIVRPYIYQKDRERDRQCLKCPYKTCVVSDQYSLLDYLLPKIPKLQIPLRRHRRKTSMRTMTINGMMMSPPMMRVAPT